MTEGAMTEGQALTWDEIQIGDVVIYEGGLYWKITTDDMVRVRPKSGGGVIGYGRTFKYDPSWNLTFTKVEREDAQGVLRKETFHEARPAQLWTIASSVVIGILLLVLCIGIALWKLVGVFFN